MFRSIVEAVFHYASSQPEKLCLADDNGSVTYFAYAEKVRKLAKVFQQIGVAEGATVVVEACQTIDYLAVELALQLIKAVFVPVEHNCAGEKLLSFTARAKAQAVITEKELAGCACKALTYEELTRWEKETLPCENYTLPETDLVSEILFSTGTTGKEKGIVLTHGNDIALAQNVLYGVEMERDNVEMIPSPMNHSHGLRRYYANMYNGSTVVLLGSVMNILKFFKNMDEYQVNAIDLVPAALTVVLKLSKNKLADYADRLRYIQYGAAPLAEADKEKVCALLPKTRMYNFYGSTESGCTCIYNFNTPAAKKNCIGKPTHNVELLMVNDDRLPIVASEETPGLVATKGGMNMLEYWEDPEETAGVLVDGVVYSNDIGYLDADGDLILLGRKGDVINVGGNKVSPDEIEDAVKKMEGIADCGCIGVEDAAKGRVPKLFVQMSRGAEFDPVEIRSFLGSKLEPYKVPVYIVQIDKIPRSFNGKLLRKELK